MQYLSCVARRTWLNCSKQTRTRRHRWACVDLCPSQLPAKRRVRLGHTVVLQSSDGTNIQLCGHPPIAIRKHAHIRTTGRERSLPYHHGRLTAILGTLECVLSRKPTKLKMVLGHGSDKLNVNLESCKRPTTWSIRSVRTRRWITDR